MPRSSLKLPQYQIALVLAGLLGKVQSGSPPDGVEWRIDWTRQIFEDDDEYEDDMVPRSANR